MSGFATLLFCMNIDEVIYRILEVAGQRGLTIKKVSLHVHNACNGLFEPMSYNDVYKYVKNYLYRMSKNGYSGIESMEERGLYRLKSIQDSLFSNSFYGDKETKECLESECSDEDKDSPSLFD